MEDDNNQQTSSQLSAAEVQGQLAGMSQDIKEMALSIASLVKVMTPMNDSAVVQNDQQRSADPRTVQGMTDPFRVTEEPGNKPMLTEDDNAGVSLNEENDTYAIEESIRAFLELAFANKTADNKIRKTWETKFKVSESDATRCPKLDTIIKGVVRKDSFDEGRKLLRLQNFMLDTAGPFVAAFEELGKDELDPDHVSAVIQHALLFLGNASVHFSQIRRTKILNPEVQSLAKDMDFSQSAPYLFGQGIEQKIKEHVDAVCMLKRTTNTEFKPKNFFEGLLLNKQDQEEQISDTGPLSTLQPKPKRFRSKKDLLKDKSPRSGSMNSTSNSQQKSNSVSVAINTCILASHVVNCSINNNRFHSSPSLSSNLALQ